MKLAMLSVSRVFMGITERQASHYLLFAQSDYVAFHSSVLPKMGHWFVMSSSSLLDLLVTHEIISQSPY